ncbi:colanic acid biosynthesis glycosyltransferase WcaL [Dankookia rubra]|uniref:Colanic acid biosynthesis glycosyltransferase WcaL n=2 Tax=Dankookia rubra TaxID=1442381 RepID=A0A4R5Q9T9_9PROT|nr:colanic acid biosynthesis glycosyltransferase WcaL [Dankookia rubra]
MCVPRHPVAGVAECETGNTLDIGMRNRGNRPQVASAPVRIAWHGRCTSSGRPPATSLKPASFRTARGNRPPMPDGAAFNTAPPIATLHVLAAFPVLSETFISNEIRALRARGHRVVPLAIAPYDGPCQPEDEAFRAETVALGDQPRLPAMLGALAHPAGLARALAFCRAQRALSLPSLLLAGARAALVARRAGVRHVHAHYAHGAAAIGIVAARLSGLTCSFISHGYDLYGSPTDIPAKLAAADAVVATCEDMKADFLAMRPGTPVHVIPCGVDPARFRRPATPPPSNGRILAIGRLAEQKGYPVLIEALALLPEAERPVVEAVGAGPLLAELQALAAARGVAGQMRFLGPRPSTWIAEHGPAYAGFVAPYVICANGDRDTSPVSVKEAMGMELPVLASTVTGNKEMVTPETGRLVEPADAAALAEGLRWLAGLAPEERRRLGAAGRQRLLDRFTLDRQAECLGAVFAGCRDA